MNDSCRVSGWEGERDPLVRRRMGKLIEESGETLDVAGRIIIQGIDEIDPGTGDVNRYRLEKELADLYAQIDETVGKLNLNARFIEERRRHKRELMRQWESLLAQDET